jgi:O-antigen ligase
VLLVALGGLFPLLMLPGVVFHYDTTPKMVLLAVVLAAGLVANREFAGGEGGRRLIWLSMATGVVLLLATVFSARPWLSGFGSAWRRMGLVPLVMVLGANLLAAAQVKREGLVRLLRAMTVAGILASVYCIAQYFDFDPFQNPAGYHAYDGDFLIVRPPGTMGHADYFGWWLAVETFCALALFRGDRSKAWRRVALAGMILCGVAVFITGTRSAWLAVIVGGMVYAVLSGFGWRRFLPAMVLCAAVFAALLFSPLGTRMRARFVWSGDEPAVGGRVAIWRDAVRMAAARPLLGYGPETFPTEFLPWQSEELVHTFPDVHQESSHNAVLDATTAAGLPGLIVCLCWVGYAGWCARRALRAVSVYAAPLAAALAASGICALFSVFTPPTLMASLLVIGMVVGPGDPAASRAQAGGLVPHGLIRICKIAAGTAALGFGIWIAVSDWRLERFARQPTVNNWVSYSSLRDPGASEDIFCSRALANACAALAGTERAGCATAARQAATRAVDTADDVASAWYNLAEFTAAVNDLPHTRAALERARTLAPQWFKPHWMLARLQMLTGDRVHAREEAERAVSLDHYKDAEVTQTRDQIAAVTTP